VPLRAQPPMKSKCFLEFAIGLLHGLIGKNHRETVMIRKFSQRGEKVLENDYIDE
jgi:hypothetical protein